MAMRHDTLVSLYRFNRSLQLMQHTGKDTDTDTYTYTYTETKTHTDRQTHTYTHTAQTQTQIHTHTHVRKPPMFCKLQFKVRHTHNAFQSRTPTECLDEQTDSLCVGLLVLMRHYIWHLHEKARSSPFRLIMAFDNMTWLPTCFACCAIALVSQ